MDLVVPVAADAGGTRCGQGERNGRAVEHMQAGEVLLVGRQALQELGQVHHHQAADGQPVGRRHGIGLQRRVEPGAAAIGGGGRAWQRHGVAMQEDRLAGAGALLAQGQQMAQIGLQVLGKGCPAGLGEVASHASGRRAPFGLAAQQALFQRHGAAVLQMRRRLCGGNHVIATHRQQDAVPYGRVGCGEQANELGRRLQVDHVRQRIAAASAVHGHGRLLEHQLLQQAAVGLRRGNREPGIALRQEAPALAFKKGRFGAQIVGRETGQVIQERAPYRKTIETGRGIGRRPDWKA